MKKKFCLMKEVKSFFIKMKKNKIAFDDKMKLLEHIKKDLVKSQHMVEEKNIQNLRVNYLKNYFNTIDNLKYTWKKN